MSRFVAQWPGSSKRRRISARVPSASALRSSASTAGRGRLAARRQVLDQMGQACAARGDARSRGGRVLVWIGHGAR